MPPAIDLRCRIWIGFHQTTRPPTVGQSREPFDGPVPRPGGSSSLPHHLWLLQRVCRKREALKSGESRISRRAAFQIPMPDDQHHGGEYQRQHRIRQLVDVVHSASPISSVPGANVPGTARERRFGQFGSAASMAGTSPGHLSRRYFGGWGGFGMAVSRRIFHFPPSRTSVAVHARCVKRSTGLAGSSL